MITAVTDLMLEATERLIMPRFQALSSGQVRAKSGPRDLVTIADEEAECWLTPRLSALLPGSVVVGEEAVASNPAVLEHLTGSAPVWLIDPVDGTWNFAAGEEDFCVMVALVQRQVVQTGWIMEPMRSRVTIAQRGQGAWQQHLSGGERSRLPGPPGGALPSLSGFAYHQPLKGRALPMTVRRLGSAGVEYVRLASGLDSFSLYDRNMPWDHAAGSLIVEECAGTVAHTDGAPYRPGPRPGPPLLSAPDPGCWRALREAMGLAPRG